jgi:hypothetical protein
LLVQSAKLVVARSGQRLDDADKNLGPKYLLNDALVAI